RGPELTLRPRGATLTLAATNGGAIDADAGLAWRGVTGGDTRPGSGARAEVAGHAPHRLAGRDPERRFLLQLAPHRAGRLAPCLGHAGLSGPGDVPDQAAARHLLALRRRDLHRVRAAAGRGLP